MVEKQAKWMKTLKTHRINSYTNIRHKSECGGKKKEIKLLFFRCFPLLNSSILCYDSDDVHRVCVEWRNEEGKS